MMQYYDEPVKAYVDRQIKNLRAKENRDTAKERFLLEREQEAKVKKTGTLDMRFYDKNIDDLT